MRNAFAVKIGEKISHLSIEAEKSLMELSCDTCLKFMLQDLSVPVFCIYTYKHFILSHLATEVFLNFGITRVKKLFQEWHQLNRVL
jgi:hypothetical protein